MIVIMKDLTECFDKDKKLIKKSDCIVKPNIVKYINVLSRK